MEKNGWCKENTSTILKWISQTNKQNYIYETALDTIQYRFKALTLVVMILSGIQSLITVSNLSIDSQQHSTLSIVFKTTLSIASIVILVITGYIKESKFEETIKSYTLYLEKLDSFLTDITTIMDVRAELRPEANEFILLKQKIYIDIYKKSPYVSQRIWKKSIKDYNEFVKMDSIEYSPIKELYRSRANKYVDLDIDLDIDQDPDPDPDPDLFSDYSYLCTSV